jgi:hypothetical protein
VSEGQVVLSDRRAFPGDPAGNLSRVTGVLLVDGEVGEMLRVVYGEVDVLIVTGGGKDESLLEKESGKVSKDCRIASEMEFFMIPEQRIGDITAASEAREEERETVG